MDNNKTKNLLNISLLQAFGILCVLLGHSVHIFSSWGWYFHQAPINTTCNIIHHFVYSFHMPLFIFLSGYSVCDSMCPKIGNILLFGISNRKIRKTNLQLFYK